jgi:hypothetical protein
LHVLLDGYDDEPVDPAVQRLWMVSRICEEFSCLPSQALRELDTDPERLALMIPDLRAYAAAKRAFDAARGKADASLDAWEGSPHMTLVQVHTLALRLARIARARQS